MTRTPLKFGLVAELYGEEDGVPPAPGLPPPSTNGTRRWAKNGHLWETCDCVDCRGRRAGHIDDGYDRPAKK